MPKKQRILKIVKPKVDHQAPKLDLDAAKTTLVSFYRALINVFSASDSHLIVGRDKEEAKICACLKSARNKLIYICGHPGQGKTAVLNQVLHDHFSERLVFKYNAMTFNSLATFVTQLNSDIESKLTD